MPAVTVKATGPLFDRRGPAIVDDFVRDAVAELARVGEADVQIMLSRVLRNPSRPPRYQASIEIRQRQVNNLVILGDLMVYGPWLEGVGSRNKTTRFKGYATFRKVGQALNAKADQVVAPILVSHLRRLR